MFSFVCLTSLCRCPQKLKEGFEFGEAGVTGDYEYPIILIGMVLWFFRKITISSKSTTCEYIQRML